MDICRFVSSKAVREYLKETGYSFNTLEAAYLIYFCKGLTLKEKHNAWKEVIETMPDMSPAKELPHCSWRCFEDSIHDCLKQHMENEDRLVETVSAIKEGAFLGLFYDSSGGEWSKCIATDIDDIEDKIAMEISKDYYGVIKKIDVICKSNKHNKEYIVTKNRNGEIMSVSTEMDRDTIEWQIEDMWFDIPTPFKKGDILIDPDRPESSGFWDGPFVLIETAPEFYKRKGRKGGCDFSDMTAFGYFQDEKGRLYDEVMHDYLSLEYYPEKELCGYNRTLVALSRLVKGEIDEVLFANAYDCILLQEQAKEVLPEMYTEETLKQLKILE